MRPQEREDEKKMRLICDSIEIWYYAFNINSKEQFECVCVDDRVSE